MTFLFTGGNGFLGKTLIKNLSKEKNNFIYSIVRNTDNKINSENIKYLKSDIKDIFDLEKKIDSKKIDFFIHLAWEGSTGKNKFNLKKQNENIANSIKCIEFAKKINVKKFISFGSIAEEYSQEQVLAKGHIQDYNCIYGITKKQTYNLLKIHASKLNINFAWCVLGNIYGEGDYSNRFINMLIQNITKEKKMELSLCNQNYNFLYIDDFVKMFNHVIKQNFISNRYVLTSCQTHKLKWFVKKIKKYYDPNNLITFNDNKNLSVKRNKIKNNLGLKYLLKFKFIKFSKGIKLQYNWYKKNITN